MKTNNTLVRAFWKGTVMFESRYNEKDYNTLVEFLDTNTLDQSLATIDEVKFMLDIQEVQYQDEERNNGHYSLNLKEATFHLLLINDLVNKLKVVEDDDMNGLLIMREY